MSELNKRLITSFFLTITILVSFSNIIFLYVIIFLINVQSFYIMQLITLFLIILNSFMLIFFDEMMFLDLSKKSKLLNQPFHSSEEVQWEITDKNLIGLKRINDSEVRAIQVIEFDNQQRISSSDNYLEGNLENEIISDEKDEIGKILINDNYPFAVIKVKNEKFDFGKTFNCGSAKVRINKPDWL